MAEEQTYEFIQRIHERLIAEGREYPLPELVESNLDEWQVRILEVELFNRLRDKPTNLGKSLVTVMRDVREETNIILNWINSGFGAGEALKRCIFDDCDSAYFASAFDSAGNEIRLCENHFINFQM